MATPKAANPAPISIQFGIQKNTSIARRRAARCVTMSKSANGSVTRDLGVFDPLWYASTYGIDLHSECAPARYL